MLNFGSGRLVGMRNDITGQTPAQFGVLQDISADMGFTEKELMGTGQFPVAVARGAAKWSIKAKSAQIDAKLFNSIFFGQTLSAGQKAAAFDELHTVPASSPFSVAVTNSSNFLADEGVTYQGPFGLPLASTSGAPAASAQYEPSSSGVYTFSSSDAGNAVLINYLFTLTTGEQIQLSNLQQGTTPTFGAVFRNRDPQTGLFMTLVINKAHCSKLTLASKNSDWAIPEFDISVMDDGTGNIGTLSFGDAS